MSAAGDPPTWPEHLLLFDGTCNLCNGVVQFIIKRDDRQRFHFATLGSATARQLLGDHAEHSDSFVYCRNGRVLQRSTAALHVARQLSGAWPLAYALIVVPRFLRDAVYDLVARKRYRWFGRRDTCMVPGPELAGRFLP